MTEAFNIDCMGFDYVGCEIDKDYFEKEEERFREHSMQINLFLGG